MCTNRLIESLSTILLAEIDDRQGHVMMISRNESFRFSSQRS